MESKDNKNNQELNTVLVVEGNNKYSIKNVSFVPKNTDNQSSQKHFTNGIGVHYKNVRKENKSFLQKQSFYYGLVVFSFLYFLIRFLVGILFNV